MQKSVKANKVNDLIKPPYLNGRVMKQENTISILGSGWLGQPLAEHFKKAKHGVHLSTRSSDKATQLQTLNVVPYVVDIENLTESIQPFLQADILIINITCKVLSAYQSLLNEIEKSPIKKVLFISSTSVYPSHYGLCKEDEPLTEETNLRCIEKLFSESNYFDCTILRFAGLIGAKRHPGRFFASGKSIKDGNGKVNLIHQDDCLKLINTILAKNAWGEIFNGCADNHPTKKDYYSQMAKLLGYPEPDCVILEKSATKVVCNQKIKEELGFEFIHPDTAKIVW